MEISHRGGGAAICILLAAIGCERDPASQQPVVAVAKDMVVREFRWKNIVPPAFKELLFASDRFIASHKNKSEYARNQALATLRGDVGPLIAEVGRACDDAAGRFYRCEIDIGDVTTDGLIVSGDRWPHYNWFVQFRLISDRADLDLALLSVPGPLQCVFFAVRIDPPKFPFVFAPQHPSRVYGVIVQEGHMPTQSAFDRLEKLTGARLREKNS